MNYVSLDRLRTLAVAKGLRELKIGVPTFVNITNTEGIEWRNGIIQTITIKENQRVYEEPIQDKMILEIINMPEKLQNGNGEKLPEKTQNKPLHMKTPKNGIIIPDTITSELLKKWETMTTYERLLMVQVTPHTAIKYKPKGSGKVPYCEGSYMQNEANMVFLFAWSDFIDSRFDDEQGCSVFGGVTAKINGESITHTAIGIDLQEFTRDEKKPVFTKHELFKNAHMDMIKKSLSKFGFNQDVYRGEV